MHWSVAGAGFGGFLLYEALRLYKRRQNGLRAIPDHHYAEHFLVLAFTGVVLALLSSVWISDPRNGAWVCFSAPTSAGALFGLKAETVESDALPTQVPWRSRMYEFLRDHFGL